MIQVVLYICFAVDKVIIRILSAAENYIRIQVSSKWGEHWKIDFNAKEFLMLEMGEREIRPGWNNRMGNEQTDKVRE